MGDIQTIADPAHAFEQAIRARCRKLAAQDADMAVNGAVQRRSFGKAGIHQIATAEGPARTARHMGEDAVFGGGQIQRDRPCAAIDHRAIGLWIDRQRTNAQQVIGRPPPHGG